jgi:hypothetical protein
MVWPQVRHIGWVTDPLDPLFSTWRLAWIAHQVRLSPAHLYDANIFHPEPYALAYSDGMPLTGLAASPLIWAGARPLLVHNLFVLASFVLSGLAMYVLVRDLVRSRLAALVAGTGFACLPFRFEHIVHLELLGTFWMPLALWALHRAVSGPTARLRFGILAGLAVAGQYLTGMYFGVFLGAYLVVVGGVLLLGAGRSATRGLTPLVAGAVLAGVLVLPTLPPYVHVKQAIGVRPLSAVRMYSATLADYVTVHQPQPRSGGCNERQVFPGFLLVGLALAGLWPPISKERVAYAAALAVSIDLSLGTNGFLYPLFYDWCLPFRGLRAAARYAMLAGLSLSVLAGFGTARLLAAVRTRRWRVAAAVAIAAVVLLEPRPGVSVQPPPPLPGIYLGLERRGVEALAELPMRHAVNARYLYYSTFHWQPLVNGYSGALPASYRTVNAAAERFPDDYSISVLRAYGTSHVTVHEEFYGREVYRDVIAQFERRPDVALLGRSTESGFETRLYALYR